MIENTRDIADFKGQSFDLSSMLKLWVSELFPVNVAEMHFFAIE